MTHPLFLTCKNKEINILSASWRIKAIGISCGLQKQNGNKSIFKIFVMKKLNLNKQTIARLTNPDKIYGGEPITYYTHEANLDALSEYYNGDPGTACKSASGGERCVLSAYWNCPSYGPSFCHVASCNDPQSAGWCNHC